jgi:hypothetical protein
MMPDHLQQQPSTEHCDFEILVEHTSDSQFGHLGEAKKAKRERKRGSVSETERNLLK